MGLVAAGVAFYAIFAVFPGLATLVSLWSFWADPLVLDSYLAVANEFIPPEAFGLIESQVHALVAAQGGSLGWGTFLSLGVALWSTRAGLDAVVQGLNAIEGRPNRHGLVQMLVALVLTIAVIAMAIAAMGTVVVVPILLQFLPLGPISGRLIAALPWLLTLCLLMAVLGLVYRYGPNLRQDRRVRWISPGSVLALVLWFVASTGFSLYLTNFASYNRVYGSLGAGVALLMWFFLSAYAVLLGAALNHVLAEARRSRAAKILAQQGETLPPEGAIAGASAAMGPPRI